MYRKIKRSLDFILSFVALIVLSPVFIILIIVKLCLNYKCICLGCRKKDTVSIHLTTTFILGVEAIGK